MSTAYATFQRGDLTLWLSGPEFSACQPMPDEHQPEAGGSNRLALEVNERESLVANLRSAGVHFRNEPISGPGGQQMLIEDPSGNHSEVFQPA